MTVLVIAPHADDEVLGAGGTIAKLVRQGCEVAVAVMTGHGEAPHPLWPRENWDRVRGECRQAAKILGVDQLNFHELPAACLDVTPAWQINEAVDCAIREAAPEEILVPFAFDLHRDHSAISYAVTVATRPYLQKNLGVRRILAYEVLSETHLTSPYMSPSFQPNVYVDITETLEVKLEAMRAYKSQIQEAGQPRSLEALRALATLRGSHVGASAAEGFVLLGEYR